MAHAAGTYARASKRHRPASSLTLQFFNNRDDADVTNGLSVPVFMDWLEELDPIISINDTCARAPAAARAVVALCLLKSQLM